MDLEYVVWESKEEPNCCSLDEFLNVEKQYRLTDGVPMLVDFPSDASFTMDPDFPTDMVLVDNLINTDGLVIVSQELKEFLAGENLQEVEFLPVTIINHKGRPVPDPYFIVHPINHVECLDLEESEAEFDLIDTDAIDSVEQIALDDSKVDSAREFFRPAPFCDVALISKRLAQAIDDAGFTGVRWIELTDYPEE